MKLMNDESIEPQALSIATYFILTKERSLNTMQVLLTKPKAKEIIQRLLDSESDILTPTPKNIGIEVLEIISSSNMQQILDVKKMKNKPIELNIPSMKYAATKFQTDFLFSCPVLFFRIYTCEVDQIKKKVPKAEWYEIRDNIYEVVYKESKISTSFVENFIDVCDTFGSDVIFCSHLKLFKGLVFISNYIKFWYCINLQKFNFNPTTYDELKYVNTLLTFSQVFLYTKNLNLMPKDTHGPLTVITGERPSKYVDKFENYLYPVEGSRPMMLIGKPADTGTLSNYIEIIQQIDLPSCDNIV
jgi:hypothetical protein